MQHDFVLLDRSGSMQSLWTEALSSVNAYVAKLAVDKVDTGVTLATFDGTDGRLAFDVIRDRITPLTWRKVSDPGATPRGITLLQRRARENRSPSRSWQLRQTCFDNHDGWP